MEKKNQSNCFITDKAEGKIQLLTTEKYTKYKLTLTNSA